MVNTKNKLDVLLINPGNLIQVYQTLGLNISAIEPPVWSGLMATFVRRKGCSVQILDANAENLTPAQTAQKALELKPLLIAVVVYGHQPSASTQIMPAASSICSAIKAQDPSQKVFLVGGHVSALPDRTLSEESADFVSSGEGPHTLLELIEALKAGGSENLKKVRGLLYKENGKIQFNAPAPLVKNLDEEMPEMAWDLLPMEKYRAHNWHCFGHLDKRAPYASFYTTLGCPYHCTFCCIQSPYKTGEKESGLKEEINSYRFWNPKTVVDQIGKLVNEYGVRNIKIADEMFVLNARHVFGICDLIIERGYDLNIWAYARIDTIKDNMLDKLKRAGVNWLAFGIESGSERVRDNVDKAFDQEDIRKVIQKVKDAGINIIGNYIFGLPEDDMNSMKATLDLALELNCEFTNFYCAMAYPGSPLYQQAIREKWALPKAWSGYSQHSVDMLPLATKHLPASDVIRFRDQAFEVYFKSPKYLEMVRQKFGEETLKHIQAMLSHQLKRQFVSSSTSKTSSQKS